MATVTVTEQLDPPDLPQGDAQRLNELGYEQELKRGMGIFDSVAMGFATISPVVGLYAVVLVGMVVAGGAWLWVLPVALAGQCLLLGGLLRAGGEVPDRQRRLPVEPPADRAALRLVRRLGRAVRVRRGQHDDRLPGRAVGADAARASRRPRTRS